MTPADHYAALGVKPDATAAEIKSAYRRIALAHHPDHSDTPESARLFALAGEAYGVLSDLDRRKHYDHVRALQERRRLEEVAKRTTAPVQPRPAAPKPSPPKPAPPKPVPIAEEVTRLNLAFTRGKYAEAETLARGIIARDPRQAIAYAVLGDLARGKGNLDEAQKMYAYATQMDPRNDAYAKRYEELLNTMSRRPSLQTGIQHDDPKSAALGIGGLLILIMAAYVGFTKETPVLGKVPFLASFTLGAIIMLFLSGVVLGASLSSANVVDRFVSTTANALGQPTPTLALATVAIVNFWAAAGLYVGLGLAQKTFNLSTTRTIVGVAGLVLLFTVMAMLSPVLVPAQLFLWGGNLAYLGTISGWMVADSLKRG